MSFRRGIRFLALMVFILVVVLLLARSSILELRARAEEEFVRKKVDVLKDAAAGSRAPEGPVFFYSGVGVSGSAEGKEFQGKAGEILERVSSESGGFRRGEMFWVYSALEQGGFIFSRTPYEEVISWTKGFEARERRNVILVMAAFAVFTLVWMWADRRAILASQRAEMVETLERKVAERTEALERMNRMARLGEFAASMAHEIRNPLSSLVTSARLLPDVQDREEQDELVGVIRRESARLDRILVDFLVFSRELRLKIRLNPLNSVIQRSLRELKRSDEFKGVKVEYSLDERVGDVSFDAEHMEQVFWNISLNSGQAMGGEGKLTVSSRRRGPWVEISFKDEGPGIPPEKIEKVFEPFYTEKSGGTGLGLSIASRIVEAHKGFIQVSGGDDGGAVFRVYLPVEKDK